MNIIIRQSSLYCIIFSHHNSISITHPPFFLHHCIATSTTTSVGWNALGNKLEISPNLSESSTLEDVEETEKGTVGNGDQEDIDRHPTVVSIIIYYMNKKFCYLGRDLL